MKIRLQTERTVTTARGGCNRVIVTDMGDHYRCHDIHTELSSGSRFPEFLDSLKKSLPKPVKFINVTQETHRNAILKKGIELL